MADRTHLTHVMEEEVNPPLAAWHVGFVRSIMHGRDGVTADLLRDEARRGGADEVATYHSTGNVIFRAEDGPAVCQHLTRVLSPLVERDTTVVHRTAGDVAALVRADPSPPRRRTPPSSSSCSRRFRLTPTRSEASCPTAWDYLTFMAPRTPPSGAETGRALTRIR